MFETHSTSLDNERGLASGWRDVSLSTHGIEQARELGRRRVLADFAAIFSSDLRRATETVELAFPGASIPIFSDWRLRECDYGRLSGEPVDIVHGDRRRYLNVPYPEGESWAQALARVEGCLRELRARWDGRKVLIVGHLATRWALERLAKGQRPEEILVGEEAWHPGWEYQILEHDRRGSRLSRPGDHRPPPARP